MLKSKNHFLLLSCLLIILFLVLFNLQLPGINKPALTSSGFTRESGCLTAESGSSAPILPEQDIPEKHEEYIVDSGDTLWRIARQRGCNSRDTRELVYKIMEYNEMTRADLTPGDKLLIPSDLN